MNFRHLPLLSATPSFSPVSCLSSFLCPSINVFSEFYSSLAVISLQLTKTVFSIVMNPPFFSNTYNYPKFEFLISNCCLDIFSDLFLRQLKLEDAVIHFHPLMRSYHSFKKSQKYGKRISNWIWFSTLYFLHTSDIIMVVHDLLIEGLLQMLKWLKTVSMPYSSAYLLPKACIYHLLNRLGKVKTTTKGLS